MNIYLDLETIPAQRDDVRQHIISRVEPPRTTTTDAGRAKWEKEKRPAAELDAYKRTALEGAWGNIIVACYAAEDANPIAVVRNEPNGSLDAERDTLTVLFSSIRNDLNGQHPHFIGWNVQFDLKFLWKRAVVHGIKPPFRIPHDDAPWKGTYTDLMVEWCGTGWQNSMKLTDACLALGLSHEDDISGADVYDRWLAGDLETIVKHCVADVERVRDIHKRVRFDGR